MEKKTNNHGFNRNFIIACIVFAIVLVLGYLTCSGMYLLIHLVKNNILLNECLVSIWILTNVSLVTVIILICKGIKCYCKKKFCDTNIESTNNGEAKPKSDKDTATPVSEENRNCLNVDPTLCKTIESVVDSICRTISHSSRNVVVRPNDNLTENQNEERDRTINAQYCRPTYLPQDLEKINQIIKTLLEGNQK